MIKTISSLMMVLALACSIGLVAAQDQNANNDEEITSDIAMVIESYGEYANTHDAEGYVSLYAEDVLWSPPNGPDQTDTEGIQTAIQGLFDRLEFDVEPQADEIQVLGDHAYVIGTINGVLTPRSGDDPLTVHFRILWILHSEQGEWKIIRQIWNNKPIEE